jgi:pimeloyl-ACP methyl ester carboxylesterase
MNKSGYVDVTGGKLYYEMAGEGETLVLLHAGFVDSGMWDSQWGEFSQRYQVIRYDMRGAGRSEPSNAPYSPVEDLHALLTHLDIEKAHLLGCSMGGTTVIDFTLTHPKMVSSLIPIAADPSGFEMQGDPPPHLFEMMDAVKSGDMALASDLQIRIWVDGMYRQPEQVDPKVREYAAKMNQNALKNGGSWNEDPRPLDPPAVTRLGEIQVLTLVMVGSLDNPELVRAADLMAAEIPGAQKVVIPDAAHVPSMEKPELFNKAVLDFLGQI